MYWEDVRPGRLGCLKRWVLVQAIDTNKTPLNPPSVNRFVLVLSKLGYALFVLEARICASFGLRHSVSIRHNKHWRLLKYLLYRAGP